MQAAPLYLSEIAPPKWRGAFNAGFNFFVGIGVVAAGCINFGTAKHTWGWRVSLGLAVVPAAVMTMGALLITDTPSSLVERGKIDQARRALHKARGSSIDVEPELEELIKWSKIAKSVEQEPFKTIFERQYRPHLVMAIAITFFQQLTGINVVAFYAPNLFQSVGLGHDAALFSAIILGAVNLASIVLGTAIVDRFGRRFLFITGGTCMFVTQVSKWSINFFKLFIILLGLFDTLLALIITIFVMTTVKLVLSIVLAVVTGVHGTKDISNGNAIVVLVLLSLYTASFGGSWGSLTWLIPSEIFPLKIRSTGQSIAIAVQFVTIFIVSQTFLTMLCHFKFGAFVFYAGWIVVMTIFIIFFLPETKGIPLESMYIVWSKHWFWGRFVKVPQENLP